MLSFLIFTKALPEGGFRELHSDKPESIILMQCRSEFALHVHKSDVP